MDGKGIDGICIWDFLLATSKGVRGIVKYLRCMPAHNTPFACFVVPTELGTMCIYFPIAVGKWKGTDTV